MRVEVDASGLAAGEYEAIVRVEGDTSDRIRVVLRVVEEKPADEVTVDDRDTGFWATPYFWVGHRFSRCPRQTRLQRLLSDQRRAGNGGAGRAIHP